MKQTKRSIAEKVRKYFHDRRLAGITLEVVEEGIYQIDSWWRVPLRPSAWPEKMFAYYEELAEIEMEIKEKEGLDVLFATDEPEEAQAA